MWPEAQTRAAAHMRIARVAERFTPRACGKRANGWAGDEPSVHRTSTCVGDPGLGDILITVMKIYANPPPTLAHARGSSLKRKHSVTWTVLFASTLLTTVSRGVLELTIGKNGAYAVQFAVVVLFTVLLLVFGRPRRRGGTGWVLGTAYAFLAIALISAWFSLQINGIDYSAIYVGVTLFYVGLLTVYVVFDFGVMRRIMVGPSLAATGFLLVGVAFIQQYGGYDKLPGGDYGTFGSVLRPASLTGSFLHYPIVCAVIAFVLIGIGAQTKRPIYVVFGAIAMLGVAVSLSRSGILILGVGLVAAMVLAGRIGAMLKIAMSIAAVAAVSSLLFPIGPLIDRTLSIFNSDGAGDATRIHIWAATIDKWLASPIVVGSHTGEYSNITANLAGIAGGVTESGLLQLLVSFGVLGMVAYYLLMLGTISALPKAPPWFVAVALACIVQSAVYQSIEVLPFMVLFSMLPAIASAYGLRGEGTVSRASGPEDGLHVDASSR